MAACSLLTSPTGSSRQPAPQHRHWRADSSVTAVVGISEPGGMSQTTVAVVRDTLATILERAVKDRILPYNPVHAVDSVQRATMRAYRLSAAQASAFPACG